MRTFLSSLVLACTIATLILYVFPNNSVYTALESMDESAKANGFLSSVQKYRSAQSALSDKDVQLNNMQQQLFSLEQQLETKPVTNVAASTGVTYSPSSNVGVSSEDQSPRIPARILKAEDSTERKMKRLRRLLKKSESRQSKLIQQIRSLHQFIKGEVSQVKDLVTHVNTKLTDDISSYSHDIVGVSGSPGLPGPISADFSANRGHTKQLQAPNAKALIFTVFFSTGMKGTNGAPGQDGFPGTQGPRSVPVDYVTFSTSVLKHFAFRQGKTRRNWSTRTCRLNGTCWACWVARSSGVSRVARTQGTGRSYRCPRNYRARKKLGSGSVLLPKFRELLDAACGL